MDIEPTKYCGYLVDPAFLWSYAKEKQIPVGEPGRFVREQRLIKACNMLIDETGNTYAQTVGVYTNSGKFCMCIALASDSTEDWLPMDLRPEDTAPFKQLLKMDIEPRWFLGQRAR